MSPASVNKEGKFNGPSGTGPYKLEKHVKDQEIVLVQNNEYWGEKGTLDRVVFRGS